MAGGIEQQLFDGQRQELGRMCSTRVIKYTPFTHFNRASSVSGVRLSEQLQHGSVAEPLLDEFWFCEPHVRY